VDTIEHSFVEFLLGLRSPPASLQPHAQGMATNPQVSVLSHTRLKTDLFCVQGILCDYTSSAGNEVILIFFVRTYLSKLLFYSERIFVNRGWVPRNATSWTKPNGLVSFDAVLVSVEQVSNFIFYSRSHFYGGVHSRINFRQRTNQNRRR
jgi:hypothetical protein